MRFKVDTRFNLWVNKLSKPVSCLYSGSSWSSWPCFTSFRGGDKAWFPACGGQGWSFRRHAKNSHWAIRSWLSLAWNYNEWCACISQEVKLSSNNCIGIDNKKNKKKTTRSNQDSPHLSIVWVQLVELHIIKIKQGYTAIMHVWSQLHKKMACTPEKWGYLL